MPNELNGGYAKCSLKHIDAPTLVSQEISCPVVLSAESVLTPGLIMGLHPEEMVASGNSTMSSEKSDSDSNGQELLKSMMRVLLPRAFPLLNKNSKKRRDISGKAHAHFTKCNPQVELMGMKSQDGNNGLHSFTDIISQGMIIQFCAEL